MSGIRRDYQRSIGSSLLPWAPPTLTNPRVVDVFQGSALNTRYIELDTDEDLILNVHEPIKFDYGHPLGASSDGIITILGGRHVVAMGLHVIGEPGPITQINSPVLENDLVITVLSTEGYPPSGLLRVDGEQMTYSSKTDTTFVISARRSGFFLDSANSSQTTHSVGAKVYIAEYARNGLSLRTQTGIVHVEGYLTEGFINDGLRVRGTSTSSVQMQNYHIGPVTNHEKVDWSDGHPDCIQTWGNGASEIRLANGTAIAGRAGKGIENAADTSSGTAVGKFVLRNTEFIDDGTNFLIYARSAPTTWDVANSWCVTDLPKDTAIRKAGDLADPILAPMFGIESAATKGKHFVNPSDIGIGYVSPGYSA